MKKSIYTAAALAVLCQLAACTTKKATAEPAAEDPLARYDSIEGVSALSLADGSTVIWLKDNEGDKKNPVALFGEVPASLIDSLGLAEGIPGSISTFLLKTEGHNILFDAGLGPKMGGHLTERLAAVGLTPDSIDMIYLTHLHPDHIGGLMGVDGPLFPKAEVYVGEVEYDAWMNQMTDDQAGLQHGIMGAYAQQTHQFAFGDTLLCGVVALDAVGHTPGHTAFQKSDLLIIGDLMHGFDLQIEHPEYCANFDMDKEKSVESRKRLIEYAKANGLTMAGMHLPEPGFRN